MFSPDVLQSVIGSNALQSLPAVSSPKRPVYLSNEDRLNAPSPVSLGEFCESDLEHLSKAPLF